MGTKRDTFADRVLGEGKIWDSIKGVASHLGDIERATSGEGPRPKFTDNPWAHIVHAAATYKGGSGGSVKSDEARKPSGPVDTRAKLGGRSTQKGPSASDFQKKLAATTAQEIAKRQHKANIGSLPQWSSTGDVVRPIQPAHAAQPFIPPPPKVGSTPAAWRPTNR